MKKEYIMKKQINQRVMFLLFLWAALLLPTLLLAQIRPDFVCLTRGKFWANIAEVGFEAHEGTGYFNQNMTYPGSYGMANSVFGGLPLDIFLLQTSDGIKHRIFNQGWDRSIWISGYGHVLEKNYNFVNDLTMPEEYSHGVAWSYDANPSDANFPLLYQKRMFRASWSLPEYDDFIINIMVIKNIDTRAWTDAYFGLWKPICLAREGHNRYKNDDEYTWETDLETFGDENGAFVFYDDTSWPGFGSTPAVYSIPPGDVSGDRGDPGNIIQVNSIDRRLYSPQVITEAWVDCSPNKNGEQKFWYSMYNSGTGDWQNWSANNAPEEENMRWYNGTYDDYVKKVTTENPRMDYKEAKAQGLLNAGNTWERSPIYARIIGPYDIAPGDSIEAIWLQCGGDWRRDITMKGGLAATQALPDSSIADLKKNWAAAIRIIKGWRDSGKTDWNAAITSYPPPTAGSAPRVGNEDELLLETYAAEGEGQGYILSWMAVPDDYVDPLTGVDDFAGYKIYKSEIGIEGPWEEIADLSKADAAGLVGDEGRVHYQIPSKAGIPSRFGVTTYDSDGNESGMSAHTFFAETAPLAPTNELSKVRVVPSPFKQVSGFLDASQQKRLSFVNIPSQCTIRIYTMAGELVQTLEHDGFGEKAWGSSTGNDYMLTEFATNVAPGIYFYHITSHVQGHESESAAGKFGIIK
jgi:hypothetical protein